LSLWCQASGLGDEGFRFRRFGAAGLTSLIFFPKPINRRAQSGLHLGLVHRFWTILGGILAGFIILKQLVQGFHSRHLVQAKLLKVAGKTVNQPPLVAIELALPSWILSGFWIVLDNVINGAVKGHEP
jgi:hypothetical protein